MIQSTIAGLETDNRKAQSRINRWLDLYGDGGMKREEYATKRKAAEREIEQRNAEIAQWQAGLANHRVISPEQQAELEAYRADIVKGIDNATFEDKAKYLNWLKVECIYDDRTGDMTITGLIGHHLLHLRC